MKSLFVIGTNIKEQYRIKTFLEKDFKLDFNPSVHNALDIISKKPYDMLLYDTDNVFPLKLFMDEVGKYKLASPVTALTNRVTLNKMQEMLAWGVSSIIKKPVSKARLIKGIRDVFIETQPKASRSKPAPITNFKEKEIETWLALKKDTVVTGIRKRGIRLSLPAALNKDTKVLFKNDGICRTVGYEYEQIPKFEMIVSACTSTGDYLFNVDLDFSDFSAHGFHQELNNFITRCAYRRRESRPKKTVLIAETDAFTRKFYAVALRGFGYDIKFIQDGVQTLRLIESEPIDLVIMDLMLHRLGGIEIIDELRKQQNSVPIIVATGESSPNVVHKLLPRVQNYLLKPFESGAFVEAVVAIMGMDEDPVESTLYVDVHLETNVLVTFRDRFTLLKYTREGIVFKRANPIAQGTIFLIRKDAIVPSRPKNGQPSQYIELLTTHCEFSKPDKNFLVHTEFLKQNPF